MCNRRTECRLEMKPFEIRYFATNNEIDVIILMVEVIAFDWRVPLEVLTQAQLR